jgi:hypothetical protein
MYKNEIASLHSFTSDPQDKLLGVFFFGEHWRAYYQERQVGIIRYGFVVFPAKTWISTAIYFGLRVFFFGERVKLL